ncbi:hypothetical protein EQM14_16085 [Caproiciproducens sp. NJN-50]|uniref:hypothetical protein n=1 Tax=Acutalibacteraceae TaxID=3082771 RepID=UPI000FFE0C59|nr:MULTISPECIES: hypothetical protein [Acutalibacteraceae]QAT51163.1 hypothetical protein EQM14_16085 [Caproiciproducens sp. NJN-50]
MDKLTGRVPVICFSLLLLVATPFIASKCFGYQFVVDHEMMWFVLSVFIEAVLTAVCVAGRKVSTKAANIVSQFLPPASLLYICMIGLVVRGGNVFLLTLHALSCFASCFVISVLCKNKSVFSTVCVVMNSFLLFLLLAASFFAMTFGQLVQKTVVNRVTSPDRSYTAVVIDSDQGALGGNTLVDVENNASERNAGLGRFVKITRVYTGKWGEFNTMNIEWQDGITLLINGIPYKVD